MTGDSQGPSNGNAREFVELDLRYETIRKLQAELAPRLSNDGLFLPSEEPIPTDTVVRFRIMLPGDFVLVEGTGVVVWTRGPGDEQGAPGLAIRYVTLPPESQETIDAIIDAHLASGGALFNLEPDSDIAETFPTDALDYRSLDEPAPPRVRPFTAAEQALRELEAARVTVRGVTPAAPPSASAAGPGSGVSLEDDYLESVEHEVEQALAAVREPGSQLTEPVDQELIELTTNGAEPVPTEEAGPGDSGAGSDADSVIPEFLDRWRHEVEGEVGGGGRTGRLDFESSPADAAPMPDSDSEHGDLAMVPGEARARGRGERRWWLVALGGGLAVGVIGYVIWLWSLGGAAPESTTQAADQAAQLPEEVIEVAPEREGSESEIGVTEEADTAAPPAPMPQPPVGPATVVDSIVWRSGPEGTEIVMRGNGTIARNTVETFALSEPPRILVRLREIQQEYSSYEEPVGTPEVERIRIGHHPELTPPALYVVLDVTRPDVHVVDVSVEDDTARVIVR